MTGKNHHAFTDLSRIQIQSVLPQKNTSIHGSMGFNQLFDDIWNLELLQGLKDNLKRTRKRQNASFYSISYFIHSQKQ